MASTVHASAAPGLRWPGRLAAHAAQHAHFAVAVGVAGVVALLMLPIPAALLDMLIAFNIACSVLLLMMSFYISSALGLSTFPSLILMTTVLRLSLNIASTKQILLHAHAGHIIETFGRLVMGGSVVVGLVVFAIIAIVQFIVVSKGAERVAEVGARFTLDAMPGKQMSIEADLRAGLIDKFEARRQRALLQQESHMHGSMDGAMKFVKGDAIAAIIIAIVNIVAGISIGIGVLGMSFADAVARYTLLSVGDGMVSQIPSLLCSVAAGLLITRVAGQEGQPRHLAAQIGRQIIEQPRALVACSVILCAFALVPGFPKLTFLALAACSAAAAWVVMRRARAALQFGADGGLAPAGSAALAEPEPDDAGRGVIVVPLLLRVAGNLRERLSAQQLQECMERERTAVQFELGLPFPGFQTRFDDSLTPDAYVIEVQEIPALAATLLPAAGGEPIAREAELARQVAGVVRLRPDAFVGMQEIHGLVKRAHAQLPELSDEVLRAMPLQRVADVLRRLALEGVSLRYLREVYESLLTWGAREKDPAMLTEYVRIDLGRFICHPLLDEQRRLHAVTLDATLETQLRDAVQQGPNGAFIVLPPETLRGLMASVDEAVASLPADRPAVLLATLETRRFLRRLLVARFAQLRVLSFQELPADAQIIGVARLALPHAARLRVAGE